MIEVKHKAAAIRDRHSDSLDASPVGKGPDHTLYIIDHHHLARALLEEGVKTVTVSVSLDLSDIHASAFWDEMNHRRLVYPYDCDGNGPHPFTSIPRRVIDMPDDPYRSLAWAVRMRGGFTKTTHPFAEFKWGEYFRRAGIDASDVDSATRLAKTLAAAGLPGFVWPSRDLKN